MESTTDPQEKEQRQEKHIEKHRLDIKQMVSSFAQEDWRCGEVSHQLMQKFLQTLQRARRIAGSAVAEFCFSNFPHNDQDHIL